MPGRLLRALLILWLFLNGLPALAADLRGRVTWIYDGDTLSVEGVGRVRLLGIDTPEWEDSPRDRFYIDRFHISSGQLRRVARQAKELLIERLKGKIVRLETEDTRYDKYQRLLAYLYLANGRMANRLLLERGLATVFRRYSFARKDEFLALEQQARQDHRGLWQPPPQ